MLGGHNDSDMNLNTHTGKGLDLKHGNKDGEARVLDRTSGGCSGSMKQLLKASRIG